MLMLLFATFAFAPEIDAAQTQAPLSQVIPDRFRGLWGKSGRCDKPSERLTITDRAVRWGTGSSEAMFYSTDDDALESLEEYSASHLELGESPDIIVSFTQGMHMPGREGYARCGPAMKRVRWPSR